MTTKAKPAPWNSFTKAELIRTIKTLDKRQTQLLNQVAKLKQIAADAEALVDALERGRSAVAATIHNDVESCVHVQSPFPWEQS